MAQRARAWLAASVVVAVMGGVPLLTGVDSMPLSTYPMFASRRTRTEPVDTAVVISPSGAVGRLSPRLLAGTDEVILAGVTVSDAITSGTTSELCVSIAARVAGADPGRVGSSVEVVTETYDSVRWFAGDRQPLDRWVHASCPVSAGSVRAADP